jgi:phage shock protein E
MIGTTLPLLAALLIGFWWVRHAGQISARQARVLLHAGAQVIDVRTAGEFVAGHLRQAVNLPLNEIETQVTRRVDRKDRVLLLHCQSGARSRAAVRKLRAMGYESAFNMGSYARAKKITAGK